MKSLRKKMSNQIQDDKCHNVSSMTTEGIRKMLLRQKMTLRQNVKKSSDQATKTEETVTSLYIYVGYRYVLLNTSCLSSPIYNKFVTSICISYPYAFRKSNASEKSKDDHSICKCLKSVNPKQNTSINKPKTAHNKPIYKNLSKPIPNLTTESCDQKTRYLKSETVKQELNKWLTGIYKPTHLLTIRLPENWSVIDEFKSKSHLRMIMKIFERSLLGKHWNRHHLPFIVFAENGADTDWHYHILLNQNNFTNQELQNAILATTIKLGLSFYCLKLDLIEKCLDTVEEYCSKEMKIYWNGKFDSDRMVLSHDLFYLPYNSN